VYRFTVLPGKTFSTFAAIAAEGTATEKANNHVAMLATFNQGFITDFLSKNWYASPVKHYACNSAAMPHYCRACDGTSRLLLYARDKALYNKQPPKTEKTETYDARRTTE
jgi:hypothetical protein